MNRDRDRDAAGRPRSTRARDELGRPLAQRTDEPPADPPALAPAAALQEAQLLLDDGRPFEAHEVLEASWKAEPGPTRGLWRGLAQLAVGLTHAARGNEPGAAALLLRSADSLEPYAGSVPHGVAVDELRSWARRAASEPNERRLPPRLCGQAAEDRS